jgi:hypothetical protein
VQQGVAGAGGLRAARVLAALVVSGAATAVADVRPSDISRPADEQGYGPGYGTRTTQYEGELAFYFGDEGDAGEALTLAPLVRVISPLSRHEVELMWGFVYHSASGGVDGDLETFKLGNPFLSWYYAWRTLPRQIRVGFGVAAPAATLRGDESRLDELIDLEAYGHAAAMWGQRDQWLWLPETLSLVPHFDIYFRHAFGLVWGGQVKVANLIGIGDIPDLNDGYDLAPQLDLEAAYELTWARFLLRASYVRRLLSEADDVDQITVEPDMRFRLGPVDLLARLTIPVDEPAGFAFGEGGVWGAHIGVASPTERRLPEE